MNQDTLSLINRRQRQILVHSCLYYQFNENLIQDHVYDAWSKELAELIQSHKEEFKRSVYYAAFKDYDGCSGFDLPFSDPRIVGVAESLLHRGGITMKRFRVYDKWLHETLEQSDTRDYSYRDRENMWICDITDALEDPARFVVQENTGVNDVFGRYIFEGDNVSFTEDVFGLAVSRKGSVVRSDTGMWQVMVDETVPFGLYHIKYRVILGHIYEGV